MKAFRVIMLAAGVCGSLLGEMAAHVNSKQSLWVAGTDSWVAKLPPHEFKRMLGTQEEPEDLTSLGIFPKHGLKAFTALPTNFDAREKWSNCPTIKEIRDQTKCGSCWAFGAVESMSDRTCIHLNKKVRLSASDMLSCSGCGTCEEGGQMSCAWRYWKNTGVVTENCQAYPWPSCGAGFDIPCPNKSYTTPSCKTKCSSDASRTWSSDKHHGASAYSLSGESNMMQELYENGPFEISFMVYEDFQTYKSGIYKHTTGSALGGHAVKLVGWGVENGTKYWLVANSWNEKWGEKGFFRIVRGTNECTIESRNIVAGMPKN